MFPPFGRRRSSSSRSPSLSVRLPTAFQPNFASQLGKATPDCSTSSSYGAPRPGPARSAAWRRASAASATDGAPGPPEQADHDGEDGDRGERAGGGEREDAAPPAGGGEPGAVALEALAQRERRLGLGDGLAQDRDGLALLGERGGELGRLGDAGLERGGALGRQRAVRQRGQLGVLLGDVWNRVRSSDSRDLRPPRGGGRTDPCLPGRPATTSVIPAARPRLGILGKPLGSPKTPTGHCRRRQLTSTTKEVSHWSRRSRAFSPPKRPSRCRDWPRATVGAPRRRCAARHPAATSRSTTAGTSCSSPSGTARAAARPRPGRRHRVRRPVGLPPPRDRAPARRRHRHPRRPQPERRARQRPARHGADAARRRHDRPRHRHDAFVEVTR